MSSLSKIEWTNTTWNPVTGCTKVGPGCDNCYAERFSERFRGVAGHPFEYGFDLTLRPERLLQPLGWKHPRIIFVNSMSDLFHKDISVEFIDSVFDTMEQAHWHTFQVLTKRSSLMRRYIEKRYKGDHCPPNIWLGVSVENRQKMSRIDHLRHIPGYVRFLSIEPLLGSIGHIDLRGIEWVIVGGESGPRARPMRENWVVDIRNQCVKASVAFFFKQWGGLRPKSGGRLLEGREWNQYPARPIGPSLIGVAAE